MPTEHNIERFNRLLDAYILGNLNAADAKELLSLLDVPAMKNQLEQLVDSQLADHFYDQDIEVAQVHHRLKARLQKAVSVQKPAKIRLLGRTWVRVAAAAVFLSAIATSYFLVFRNNPPTKQTIIYAEDVKAPAINKATLTLSNGKQIMLDTVANGTLIAGIARKTADGQLVFEGNASNIAYIGTTNPRNSKAMHITLPDNTQVWLNADTYLEYPTNYNAKDRLVTLKGEAYFEVKHNEVKPFRVSAGEQTIEDIGTSFNVKAYLDEHQVQTTLLEGVVKINNAVTLKPGQQYSNNKITSANTDEVMAWRNGSFYLDGRELGIVASDLSRWYDVEIVFNNPNAKHSIVFGGEMGRDLTLNQAISVLEKLNVKCRLEGKKLIVE